MITIRTPQQHARQWLDYGYLIMDTETTGLGEDAEVVEICLIDTSSFIMLNTLIKPTQPIPEEATAIHGITNDMVAHAPTWRDVHGAVAALFIQHPVIIYNATYDIRLINQTARLHSLENDGLCDLAEYRSVCAMMAYAQFYGQKDEGRDTYKWQKLTAAAEQQGVIIEGTPHRALSDCLTTLGVIKAMAAGGAA